MKNKEYISLQVQENIFRLKRQMVGIQKKISLYEAILESLPTSSPAKLMAPKIEQLTFFGT